ncbi:MAG: pentapeptide repeat-containing protein [Campylobacterota bacterium]|nr:pentapeptide repeat-containing protein [Campylobacterota bacterium]
MEEKDNLDRHLGDIFLGEIHIGNLSGLFQNLIIDTEISLNFVADEEGPKLYHYDRKKYYSISTTIKDCIFKNNVSIDNISNGIIFENCKFEKKLVINLKQAKNISYTKTDTDSQTGEPYEIVTNIDLSKEKIQVIGGKIETLEIEDSTFESKFYINAQDTDSNKKLEITKLIIKNTVFNQNFKLHNCNIDYITIEDTNFEKNADFFHTEIAKGSEQNYNDKTIPKNSIVFKSINFRGLAIFGDTEFQEKLVFKYVTFEGLSHFRNAKFYKGLDLDYSNIQEEMNFFNVSELNNTISKQNTSQETYRIIKHNFELIGNKIEANKYHALELEQKKNNLEDEIKKTTADKKIKLWFDSIVFV